jgi:hypothetical protein
MTFERREAGAHQTVLEASETNHQKCLMHLVQFLAPCQGYRCKLVYFNIPQLVSHAKISEKNDLNVSMSVMTARNGKKVKE